MTDEEGFQSALDENPDDFQARLVFADWLQERGNPRAEGYRALGVNCVRPAPWSDLQGRSRLLYHDGKALDNDEQMIELGILPRDWLLLAVPGELDACVMLLDGHSLGNPGRGTLATRRQLEDFIALAFLELPPERRAELLAGIPEAKK